MYFVCWDPDLIPPKEIPSMEYIGAQPMPLDHDVTIEVNSIYWLQVECIFSTPFVA
jgi:hypothetical protein